jgi:pimeloyl-ACP methyl ester carboxylesterase
VATTTPEDLFTVDPAVLAGWDGRSWQLSPVLALAEHAVAVYKHPGDYGLTAALSGWGGGTTLERRATQVGVAFTDDVVLVAVRGSSEVLDWLHDAFSVLRVEWRPYLPQGARVGWGFRRQLAAVVDSALDYIRRLLEARPGAALYVVGHSLGGPVAAGLAAALRHGGHDPRAVLLACSPRVGNRALATWYDAELTYGRTTTWSLVNIVDGCVDLVTRVPKQRWGPLHGPAVGILRRLAEVSMDSGAARHLLRAGVRLYRAAVDFLEAGPRGDGAAGG